ncbi:MAG: hypothetical protein ACRDT0_05175 [Pseudonocardiaceae bacterium]
MSTVEHDLVASAAAARDVIEPFRLWQIVMPGWETTLQDVVEVLGHLPDGPGAALRVKAGELRRGLALLLETGLSSDPRGLDDLSTALRDVVTEVRVPGVPRPEDPAWSF